MGKLSLETQTHPFPGPLVPSELQLTIEFDFSHLADFSSSSQGGMLPSPRLSQFLSVVWVILQDLSFLLMLKS